MQSSSSVDRFGILMRAAQDGDSAAYLRLLNEITPLLRRTVKKRCAFLQASDVEDLAQEILLSLHSVRATYDSARPFLPWRIYQMPAIAIRWPCARPLQSSRADSGVLSK
jgi:hypothetical protein